MEEYCRIRGPIGPQRADVHAALVAWATVASHSKRPRRHKIEDFLLFDDPARHPEIEDDDEVDDDEQVGG